jgi:hypothetical protein
MLPNLPPNCANSRGNMFSPEDSKTWVYDGNYYISGGGLGLDGNLGYSQKAELGLDSIGLGYHGQNNLTTLANQTVAGISQAYPFYLYVFCVLKLYGY